MKIGFYSTMGGMPWGGSEVLWSRIAHRLLDDGHDVTINYRWWEDESSHLLALRDAGASVWTRDNPGERSPVKRFGIFPRVIFPRVEHQQEFIRRWLMTEQPDFVLVTLDYHLSNVSPAEELINQQIPYAINLQCASDRYSADWRLEEFRRAYEYAVAVYFVSQENLDRVETNLATKLDHAKIIDNPFNVSFDAVPGWPTTDGGFRLACVGRIHFQSKGQDILVNVLKQPKWKERDLVVSFFGEAQYNLLQLQELIELHGLRDKMLISGFAENVESIWETHHGLVLPSRYEGAALAVVEALICGRICVTTDLGRNRELIDEGETGFIAAAPTVELFDQALEQAWQTREQWQSMGGHARERIRQRYGKDPVTDFLNELMPLFEQSAQPVRKAYA